MKKVKLIVMMFSFLLLFLIFTTIISAEDDNIIYTDPEGDVYNYLDLESDSEYLTGTDELPNIDIKEVKYYHKEDTKKATLSVQVYGEIEDVGNLVALSLFGELPDDITDYNETDFFGQHIIYNFELTTSANSYSINYNNKTCILQSYNETINITDWTVINNNILSVNFDLSSVDETFEDLVCLTNYMNLDYTSVMTGEVGWYFDYAPTLIQVYIQLENDVQEVGSNVKFTADAIDEFANTGGFSYLWDFGDGSSESKLQNPTHKYNTVGNYTVKLTVEDEFGNMGNSTKIIQIIENDANGDNGNNNDNSQNGSESGLNLFITIIAVIIIIGILVIIFIIRR